jgi:hypothetical protein
MRKIECRQPEASPSRKGGAAKRSEKGYNLQKGSLTNNRTLQCWGRRLGIFGIRRMLRPSDLPAVYRIVGPAADTIALASTAVEIVALCAVPRHDEVLPHLYEG